MNLPKRPMATASASSKMLNERSESIPVCTLDILDVLKDRRSMFVARHRQEMRHNFTIARKEYILWGELISEGELEDEKKIFLKKVRARSNQAVESKGRSVLEGQPNKPQTQGPLIFNIESGTPASASALFGICLCYTWHGDVGLSCRGGLQKWPGMDCI